MKAKKSGGITYDTNNRVDDGDDFVGFYLIKESEVKQTNTTPPKEFMNLTLSDASGQVAAKLWDAAESDKDNFKALTLVKVQGIVQLYREKLQVKINRIRKTTEADGVTLTDFVRAAPVEPEKLVARIHEAQDSIADTYIRAIVAYCLDEAGDGFHAARRNRIIMRIMPALRIISCGCSSWVRLFARSGRS